MMRHLRLRIAAICLAPLVILQAQPEPAHAAAPAASAETRMDHISIVTMGKGSPVVLVAGLASPRAVWDGVAAGIAKTHRVYLVQVNGFGGVHPAPTSSQACSTVSSPISPPRWRVTMPPQFALSAIRWAA